MPVQRIVMPDGKTKAFPERASKAEILSAIEQCLSLMEDGCHQEVTQFPQRDEDFRSPDPTGHADIMATPEQRALAIQQMQALPEHTGDSEWTTTYKNGGFSKWAASGNASRGTIDGSGDFNIHLHRMLSNMRDNNKNFFPGPGDPAAMLTTGKPAFVITPDRNTLIEYGVRDGRYYAVPVYQRPGTQNNRDYQNWQPDNLVRSK